MKNNFQRTKMLFLGLLLAGIFITTFCLLIFFRLSQRESAPNKYKQNQQLTIKNTENIHLAILMYHYVENVTDVRDTIRKSLSITPNEFESQITTLINNGYEFINLTILAEFFEGKITLPAKAVIITFDDGYADFYTDALPILRKYNVPAVLFMVSGFLDMTHNYLTKEQLKEIAGSGFVEIGAHGIHHLNMNFFDNTTITSEIVQSKSDLEKLLGTPVKHFAYPYGEYSEKIIKIVEQAGYLTAVTVDEGTSQSYANRFKLRRIRPGNLTGEALINKISTSYTK